jgi:transposase
MRFVGADLHKKTITLCALEEAEGRKLRMVARRRLTCSRPEAILKFLEKLGPCEVVVEATIGFDWFAALAERVCRRVVIAHAAKLRIIAESTRKTDKIDAYILAEFLANDMIPEAWRPTPRVRQHRTLVRYRQSICRRATSVRNTIRGILTRYNADRRDLFTRTGWQAALKIDLHEAERWVLNELKQQWDETQLRLERAEEKLAKFAASAPIAEREARAVLASMPGVGPVTIDVVLAELGDPHRFKNADAVASFAGLDPGVRSSDTTRHNLKMTKAGSPLLRWIMIQLAHRLKRQTARWSRIYTPLERRIGKKKATCAIARRLLVTMYAMLRDGQAYRMPAAA